MLQFGATTWELNRISTWYNHDFYERPRSRHPSLPKKKKKKEEVFGITYMNGWSHVEVLLIYNGVATYFS